MKYMQTTKEKSKRHCNDGRLPVYRNRKDVRLLNNRNLAAHYSEVVGGSKQAKTEIIKLKVKSHEPGQIKEE